MIIGDWGLGIGDWGLGIGDWAQSPIPNPQSPIPNPQALKRIADSNLAVTTMKTLKMGIFAFKNDCLNQSNYTAEFVSSIREEIIEPLSKAYNSQTNISKNFYNEFKKAEKDYKNCVEKTEKLRQRFHMSAKSAETLKIQSEFSKQNQNMAPDLKIKVETRAQNVLKEAKENERLYITAVNEANNSKDNFVEIAKKILQEYQTLEETLIEEIKDALRKYVIYQVSIVRNSQYDIESKAKIMEDINIQADIRAFIEKHSTNAIPPYKVEFYPFVSELDNKNNEEFINYPKAILTNVKNFFSNIFHVEVPHNNEVKISK